jgi:hypothetical protein
MALKCHLCDKDAVVVSPDGSASCREHYEKLSSYAFHNDFVPALNRSLKEVLVYHGYVQGGQKRYTSALWLKVGFALEDNKIYIKGHYQLGNVRREFNLYRQDFPVILSKKVYPVIVGSFTRMVEYMEQFANISLLNKMIICEVCGELYISKEELCPYCRDKKK